MKSLKLHYFFALSWALLPFAARADVPAIGGGIRSHSSPAEDGEGLIEALGPLGLGELVLLCGVASFLIIRRTKKSRAKINDSDKEKI